MPHEDPDPQDPMELRGVAVPEIDAARALESQREMACAFAEEFARMGYTGVQILALFKKPFYAGAHAALGRLGEEEIRMIIAESASVWGRMRLVDRDADPLRVLTAVETQAGGFEEEER